jgi:glutathionyl-hydroquinone reductase
VGPVCPWARRAVIVRELLGLQPVIRLGTVDPIRPTLDRATGPSRHSSNKSHWLGRY